MAALEEKMTDLRSELSALGRVVVAFSGGADSAFLAAVAHRTLGRHRVHVVTAVSPSLAAAERDDCGRLAAEWGMRWSTVDTDELDDARYRSNEVDRCYHCKAELMRAVAPIAADERARVVLGVNLDDVDPAKGDHRPGQRAAAEAGASFPLVAARFRKVDVRAASRQLGLRTWDKPEAACLASRIPYGTAVSVAVLTRVERAEAAMRKLDFRQVRVRHYGDTARLEVELGDLERVLDCREMVVQGIRAAGYRYVTLDLEGFRTGNLNH